MVKKYLEYITEEFDAEETIIYRNAYEGGKGYRVEERSDKKTWINSNLNKIHRELGPAIEFKNSKHKEWWWDGQRHRLNGPAVITDDGTEIWYFRGVIHRDNGPAIIHPNGTEEYYDHGNIRMTKTTTGGKRKWKLRNHPPLRIPPEKTSGLKTVVGLPSGEMMKMCNKEIIYFREKGLIQYVDSVTMENDKVMEIHGYIYYDDNLIKINKLKLLIDFKNR